MPFDGIRKMLGMQEDSPEYQAEVDRLKNNPEELQTQVAAQQQAKMHPVEMGPNLGFFDKTAANDALTQHAMGMATMGSFGSGAAAEKGMAEGFKAAAAARSARIAENIPGAVEQFGQGVAKEALPDSMSLLDRIKLATARSNVKTRP